MNTHAQWAKSRQPLHRRSPTVVRLLSRALDLVAIGEPADEIMARAGRAGATVVSEPSPQPWGYAGTFADLDGHLWEVTSVQT